jgi:hypothetical protein
MSTEFGFHVVDANQLVEKQQVLVRQLLSNKLDLDSFKRADGRRPSPPAPRRPSPKTISAESES